MKIDLTRAVDAAAQKFYEMNIDTRDKTQPTWAKVPEVTKFLFREEVAPLVMAALEAVTGSGSAEEPLAAEDGEGEALGEQEVQRLATLGLTELNSDYFALLDSEGGAPASA